MKIIASMSTIPERREVFTGLVSRILYEQTRPVDQLFVCLHRYGQLDPTLPQDERLVYYLSQPGQGPWVRYAIAEQLADDDVLATLDDDTIYPVNYIEKGVKDLKRMGNKAAVSYGGLRWNPLTKVYNYYGRERNLILGTTQLDKDVQISVNQGICSFLYAGQVKGAISLTLPGWNTNDDFMISFHLQKQGIRIFSCAKPADWIRETQLSQANHALAKRDTAVRRETFSRMVYELGFDPSAGWLDEMKSIKRHLLVLCQELPMDNPVLFHELVKLTNSISEDHLLHVLAPATHNRLPVLQQEVNLPFVLHLSPVMEEGGRLNEFYPIRMWRRLQIVRDGKRNYETRHREIMDKLPEIELTDWRHDHV